MRIYDLGLLIFTFLKFKNNIGLNSIPHIFIQKILFNVYIQAFGYNRPTKNYFSNFYAHEQIYVAPYYCENKSTSNKQVKLF